MIENLELIKVTENEIQEMVGFIKENTSGNEAVKQLESMYSNANMVKLRIEKEIEVVFVARLEGRNIGMITCISNALNNPNNKSWSCVFVYVNESYRNKGIAGSLLDKFISHIKLTDAYKINATVMSEDIRTQILYISRGFRQEGYIEHGREKGADIIFFGKNLI